MRIKVREVDSSVVVSIWGRLTVEVDTGRLHCLIGQLTRAPGSNIVLDLGGLRRIDCNGIGQLVQAVCNARLAECRLRLAGLDERHRSLFELLRLDDRLPLFNNVAEALAADGREQPADDPEPERGSTTDSTAFGFGLEPEHTSVAAAQPERRVAIRARRHGVRRSLTRLTAVPQDTGGV